ncbi:MAG: acetolactate synthase large subunit [Polyangiaceae bacterium]|nr:acetolactate synthase large subunit [Polyangiaceae bacterium]
MNAAELLVRCLEAEGVRRIYGVPGPDTAHLQLALADSPIAFVHCRSDQASVVMADVHGRVTGEAGVCIASAGAAASSLLGGAQTARADGSPVVVLTGRGGRPCHGDRAPRLDALALYAPVAKWCARVARRDEVPQLVRHAFKVATAERSGPTLLELPSEVAESEASGEPLLPHRVRRPVPDAKTIDRVLQLLRTAERPIVLAGQGVVRKGAVTQLRTLVQATGIAVMATLLGKGALPRDAVECLFTVPLREKDRARGALAAADLVLCVGCAAAELNPQHWNAARDKRVVHVDVDPAEVDEHYDPEVEVVGDVAHALWMLNERLSGSPLRFEVRDHRRIRDELTADHCEFADDDTEGFIRPQKAVWDARRVLGHDDILVTDVGATSHWFAGHYQCDEPLTALTPAPCAARGFALPGAIAAKLACPERRVLAVAGDGGFVASLPELETARRTGAHVVVMVWEDHAHGMLAWWQEERFGRRADLVFANPDFTLLAQSFDWHGVRVERARGLQHTLEEAFQADRPTLVVVPIDYRENRRLTARYGVARGPG